MKLPPLNALRMFDAVARLGGVRAAAEELCVTPSAVSQQMRLLEDFMGARLLNRVGRRCELTEVGQTLFTGTHKHLRGIATVSAAIRPRRKSITVVATTTLAARWLIPRLSEFMAEHPDVQVRVEAVTHTEEYRPGADQLVIHEGVAPPDPQRAELLFALSLVPVAAPDYARAHFGRLRRGAAAPESWPEVRLLHEPEYMWWPQWFKAHGVRYDHDPTVGLHFSHLQLTLSSALHGHGVGLVPGFLIGPELAARSLVVVDPRPLGTPVSYFMTWAAEQGASEAAMSMLRRWLVDEAHKTV
jgi:LysR family glycine cleavage system transcriptional activator